MEHYTSLESIYLQDVWLTIGTFDGIHLGHQEIILSLVSGARRAGARSVALTFFPPPAVVLKKRTDPYYLTSPDERADLIGSLGVDVVITHPFTLQLATRSAEDFMRELMVHLGLKHLCVGYDFALGRKREGDVERLEALGKQLGYTLQIVSAVSKNGQVVSSSLIRSFLASGEVDRVADLLGRPYRIDGEVVIGDGRGKLLGIPTANLSVWNERALPKAGVYACRVILDGRVWGAVTNIGVRPTFESQPVAPRVETHILDFSNEIYGRHLCLEFIQQLRDETRFSGPEALVEQIHRDISHTREVLASEGTERSLISGLFSGGDCHAPVS